MINALPEWEYFQELHLCLWSMNVVKWSHSHTVTNKKLINLPFLKKITIFIVITIGTTKYRDKILRSYRQQVHTHINTFQAEKKQTNPIHAADCPPMPSCCPTAPLNVRKRCGGERSGKGQSMVMPELTLGFTAQRQGEMKPDRQQPPVRRDIKSSSTHTHTERRHFRQSYKPLRRLFSAAGYFSVKLLIDLTRQSNPDGNSASYKQLTLSPNWF